MNKEILRNFGFNKEVDRFEKGECPFCCKIIINLDKEFRDDKSKIEYRISGLCQKCQDKTRLENDTNR